MSTSTSAVVKTTMKRPVETEQKPRRSFADRLKEKEQIRYEAAAQTRAGRRFLEKKKLGRDVSEDVEMEDLPPEMDDFVCSLTNQCILRFRKSPEPGVIDKAWWTRNMEGSLQDYPECFEGKYVAQVVRKINQLVDTPNFYTRSKELRKKACGYYTRVKNEIVENKRPPSTFLVSVSEDEAIDAQLSLASVKLVPEKALDETTATQLTLIKPGNVYRAIRTVDEQTYRICPGLVIEGKDDFCLVTDKFPKALKSVQATASGCGDLYFAYKARELDPPHGEDEYVSAPELLDEIADIEIRKADFERLFAHSLWDNAMPVHSYQVFATVLELIYPVSGDPNRVSLHGNFPRQIAAMLTDRHIYSTVSANYDPTTQMKLTVVSNTQLTENVTGLFWSPNQPDLLKIKAAAGIVLPINSPSQASDMAVHWMASDQKYKVTVSFGKIPCLWVVKDPTGQGIDFFTDGILFRLACCGIWMAFHNLSNAVLKKPQYYALECSGEVEFRTSDELLVYKYEPKAVRGTWRNYVPAPITDYKSKFNAKIHVAKQDVPMSDVVSQSVPTSVSPGKSVQPPAKMLRSGLTSFSSARKSKG